MTIRSRRCAAPAAFVLAVLLGCAGAEPSTTSPATPSTGVSQVPHLTVTTTAIAPSTPPAAAVPPSTKGSTGSESSGSAPAQSQGAETVSEATTRDDDTEASDSDTEGTLQKPFATHLPHPADFKAERTPEWPFSGLIHLRANIWDDKSVWRVYYWHWPSTSADDAAVPLPGFDTDCLGQTAISVHGRDGIEIGVTDGTNPSTHWLRWDNTARATAQPTAQLLAEVARRTSNIEVTTEVDLLHLTVGEQSQTYALRQPVRSNGQRWIVQARHDGDVFIVTVHPAHLPCFSGVTWLSDARTGELLGCGASTHVVRFISPTPPSHDNLVLPDPDAFGTYLSCAPSLDFRAVDLPSR